DQIQNRLVRVERRSICAVDIARIASTRELNKKVIVDLHHNGIVVAWGSFKPANPPLIFFTKGNKIGVPAIPSIHPHNNAGVSHLVSEAKPIEQPRLIDFCVPFEQRKEML